MTRSGRKAAYREFLKTDFWKELSARKRKAVGKCEKCGSRKELQSHHLFYRPDWYSVGLEDLIVLCRRCHRAEHGIRFDRFMRHREDERFNEIIHRCHHLYSRIQRGSPLRFRDIYFLEQILKEYPPMPDDACIPFHVNQLLERNVRFYGI